MKVESLPGFQESRGEEMSQAQVTRTPTEIGLLVVGAIVLGLAVLKASVIGYYQSDLPLLLIAFAVAGAAFFAADRMRKARIRDLDREHGVE